MNLTREEKIALLKKEAKPVDKESNWIKTAKWNSEHIYAIEDYITIAMRILSELKAKNMTQRDFAKILNVTPQALTRIMKGRQNLTLNKVRQIEKALGISILQIKKTEEKQAQVKTKMVTVEVHYNISKSAYQGTVDNQQTASSSIEKDSINELSIAS